MGPYFSWKIKCTRWSSSHLGLMSVFNSIGCPLHGHISISRGFHKIHPFWLAGGILEFEVIIYLLYVGDYGIIESGGNIWIRLRSFFVVEQHGCKTQCFWKNGLGGSHCHRCDEVHEFTYIWYATTLLYFLNYFFLLNPDVHWLLIWDEEGELWRHVVLFCTWWIQLFCI